MNTFALFVAMLAPAIFVAAAPRKRRTRSRVESRMSIRPGRR